MEPWGDPPDQEQSYREAQDRLRQLTAQTVPVETVPTPHAGVLDSASPYLLRALQGMGPAVLPGAGHQLGNIASVLAQGFLGGRASTMERMFKDYEQRKKEAAEKNKSALTTHQAQLEDARTAASRAGADLTRWRQQSAILTPELAPHAPGFTPGARVPLSVYENAVKAKAEKDKSKNEEKKPPGVSDYSSLVTAVRSDKDIQDFQTVRSHYASIKEVQRSPSAAGDLALIFSFMKIVDPGSTVREGEFANAENTAGVPQRVRILYNKIMNGERLSDPQRADFLRQAQSLYQSRLPQYNRAIGQYRRLAINFGMDPELVTRDLTVPDDEAPKGWFQANAPTSGFSNPFGGK